jgi:hypothetical protein
MGVGDLLVALAGARGRSGQTGVLFFYWTGVALLYGSPTLAALMCRRDRRSLLILVVLFVAGLYVVDIVNSPLSLTSTDELQTLRSLKDLQQSHHLFSSNPLVTAYPRFPGSQIAFVTMQELTGLSFSTSARLIIGPEHLLLGISLFLFVERVSGSSLGGYAGVLVYATNASYLYFDAGVFYESFALPLAIVSILLIVLATRSASLRERRIAFILATIIGVVVSMSHHMTSYWLAAMLVLWSALALLNNRNRDAAHKMPAPWAPAVAISACAGLWYAFVARAQATQELGPVFDSAVKAIGSVVSGSVTPKTPFSSPSPLPAFNDPRLFQAIGYASVFVACVILGVGVFRGMLGRGRHAPLLRRDVRRVEILLFSLVALVFPFGLILRLTQASTETSSRSSEFAFVGLAVMAAFCVSGRARRVDTERRGLFGRSKLLFATVATGTIAVALVLSFGGVVVGQAPYDRIAGAYLVGADSRSVDPLGQETAAWTALHWAPGTKFAADPTNTRLIASSGDATPEQGSIDGQPVNHLFLSSSLDRKDLTIIEGDKIRYIVVDNRLTEFPSASGPAFGGSEPGVKVEPTAPIPYVDFAKFGRSSQLSRIYDDGTIRIYSTYFPNKHRFSRIGGDSPT